MLDVEVQTTNYEVFRADRKGRKCGGAASFLRTELQCKLELAFSNRVVEALVIKCMKLDSLFLSLYRPPNTTISEWKDVMDQLEQAINMAQSNGGYGTIMMARDFIFPTQSGNRTSQLWTSPLVARKRYLWI